MATAATGVIDANARTVRRSQVTVPEARKAIGREATISGSAEQNPHSAIDREAGRAIGREVAMSENVAPDRPSGIGREAATGLIAGRGHRAQTGQKVQAHGRRVTNASSASRARIDRRATPDLRGQATRRQGHPARATDPDLSPAAAIGPAVTGHGRRVRARASDRRGEVIAPDRRGPAISEADALAIGPHLSPAVATGLVVIGHGRRVRAEASGRRVKGIGPGRRGLAIGPAHVQATGRDRALAIVRSGPAGPVHRVDLDRQAAARVHRAVHVHPAAARVVLGDRVRAGRVLPGADRVRRVARVLQAGRAADVLRRIAAPASVATRTRR